LISTFWSQEQKYMNRNIIGYAPLIFIPLSVILYFFHFNPIVIFIITILAIIPITSYLARATNQLSMRTSTIVGSLFNVTFGNAIEFTIAIFAIRAGLIELVKASIIGSIVLNILLLIGLSMLFSGFKYKEQTFNRGSVGVASTMLLIAVAGLSMPSIYAAVTGETHLSINMSRAVSITLGITYLLSLVFMLLTHRHLFVARRDVSEELTWGKGKAILILLVFVGLAAFESQILIDVLRPILATSILHQGFVGLVIIAVITNVPEHMAAISYGLRDNITQSMEIGMNSATQIALFVAPILVLISPLLGASIDLAFAPFQLAALILSVMIINYLGSDGICNWLEGVQLTAVYLIIAIAFYFM
jgi:Ca2+:H+ antiporter